MQNHLVPKLNLSLTDEEYDRIQRLAKLRGATRGRAITEAVVHTLASIEHGERLWATVPSEQDQEGR